MCIHLYNSLALVKFQEAVTSFLFPLFPILNCMFESLHQLGSTPPCNQFLTACIVQQSSLQFMFDSRWW